MSNQEQTHTVEYEVYNVSELLESVDDEDWYEYRVKLKRGTRVVDMWDSRVETYNGVKSQRCSRSRAIEAAKEIKKDVEENGEADSWFNTPKEVTKSRVNDNKEDQ